MQPVKIRGSQQEWFTGEEWTREALQRTIGEQSVYRSSKKCKPGSKKRETPTCHTIKEKDAALVGKEWAALTPVNLTALGVATYSQLFDRQVRTSSTVHVACFEISCA